MTTALAVAVAILVVVAAVGPIAAVAWARRRFRETSGDAQQAAADHLRTVIRTAPIGLAVAERTTVLWANAAAEPHLGAPAVTEALETVARTRGAVAAEIGTGTTGRRQLQCLPLPERPAEPPLTLIAILPQQRAAAQPELASPEAHRELAHELRTPLTAVIGHVSLLEDPQSSEEVRRRSQQAIRREADRMSRLVEDLLELSRLESETTLHTRPTNVAVEIEGAAAGFVPRAEAKQVELSLLLSGDLPRVELDRDRFRQVVANLVDNALKFCAAGDRVTVSCHLDGDAVVLEVADDGPGVPSEDLPHLTRRLYRAATSMTDSEGAGLGLALVDRIVRLHDGSLELQSAPDAGFVARIRLPVGDNA
jgi:signal transduction histidine kinase